jgi:hypothetical protein
MEKEQFLQFVKNNVAQSGSSVSVNITDNPQLSSLSQKDINTLLSGEDFIVKLDIIKRLDILEIRQNYKLILVDSFDNFIKNKIVKTYSSEFTTDEYGRVTIDFAKLQSKEQLDSIQNYSITVDDKEYAFAKVNQYSATEHHIKITVL